MLRLRKDNCDAKALGWAWRSYKVTVRHLNFTMSMTVKHRLRPHVAREALKSM